MLNLLVVSFSREGFTYLHRGRQTGMAVKVLDCLEKYHPQLAQWYGTDRLQTAGRRKDVRTAVAKASFDAVVVHEDIDYVHTALIMQSLREAGVRRILVVTRDASRVPTYRRFGANRVIVAQSADEAWPMIYRDLPSLQTA